MTQTKKIEPRILKGFKDYPPSIMIPLEKMREIIRQVFKSFGFMPLETPAIEHADILLGKYGEEGQKQLYRFKDHGDRDVALKFDLTVPLSRFVAQNIGQLTMPFKRYQMQPVWRGESPQKGRFREFWQCDVDFAGTSSMVADTESIQVAIAIIKALGFDDFKVKINNRKILNGFIESLEIDANQINRVLQAMDKLAKIGTNGVHQELSQTKPALNSDNYPIDLPPLSPNTIERILEFANIKGKNIEILNHLSSMLRGIKIGEEGLEELQKVVDYLSSIDIDETKYQIDLSIARGLEYYTGTVFETYLTDAPEVGSVMSGGRFDKLIGMFTDEQIPAVGISLGLDRLFAALVSLEKIDINSSSVTKILVTIQDYQHVGEYLKIAQNLRSAGFNVEIYAGNEGTPLGKQLSYADKLAIPLAIIANSEELAQGKVIIKNLAKAEQQVVKQDELISTVKTFLS